MQGDRRPHRAPHVVAATVVALSLASLAGCAAPDAPSYDPWNIEAVEAVAPGSAPAFETALFDGYIALARQEQAEGDWRDTRRFLDQARSLARGETVPPLALEERPLSDARRAELAPARAQLMAARGSGAMSLAPSALARAQAAFECWFQEAEEDRMPVQRAHLEACRTAFEEQMASVDETLGQDSVVLLPDPDGGVGSAEVRGAADHEPVRLDRPGAGSLVTRDDRVPQTVAVRDQDQQVLFGEALDAQPLPPRRFALPRFALGTATLPPDSADVIAAIAADAARRPTFDLIIVGFADTVGGEAFNRRLGMRRAAQVRDALLAAGLAPARVDLETQGETALAVETGDNVAEALNRRVSVTVR